MKKIISGLIMVICLTPVFSRTLTEVDDEIDKKLKKESISESSDESAKLHLEKYKDELNSILGFNILHPLQNDQDKEKNAKNFLNELDSHGYTPLKYAVQLEDEASIEYMLKNDAEIKINRKFEDNKTVIFLH